MITLSFRRFGDGIYISHTDVLRALNRTLRRAEIEVNYSNGFNKHMSLKMSQPLPLGIASDDEWVTADLKNEITEEEFLKKFSDNCPPFLSPNVVYKRDRNPALSSKINASSYTIVSKDAISEKEKIEALKKGFSYGQVKHGVRTEKDSTGLIYEIRVERESIECVFAYGNRNFRADDFIYYLNEKFGFGLKLTDIVRREQIVIDGAEKITARRYMESFR